MADNNTRNVVLRDVTFFWAKLDKSTAPFGTEIYEIQVRVPKKRAKELDPYGVVKAVKDDASMVFVNMKKKAFKADGSPSAKVKVLTTVKGQELDPKVLGNGSVGHIKLMLRDYEIKGPKGQVTKRGTQVTPVAIQVTELVEYRGGSNTDGFDFDDGEENETLDNAKDEDF